MKKLGYVLFLVLTLSVMTAVSVLEIEAAQVPLLPIYTFSASRPGILTVFRSPAVPNEGQLPLVADLGWTEITICSSPSSCDPDGCIYSYADSNWSRWHTLEVDQLWYDESMNWMVSDPPQFSAEGNVWVVRQYNLYLPLIVNLCSGD